MWPAVLGILVEFQGLRFLSAQGASKNLLRWSIRDFYGYVASRDAAKSLEASWFGSCNVLGNSWIRLVNLNVRFIVIVNLMLMKCRLFICQIYTVIVINNFISILHFISFLKYYFLPFNNIWFSHLYIKLIISVGVYYYKLKTNVTYENNDMSHG